MITRACWRRWAALLVDMKMAFRDVRWITPAERGAGLPWCTTPIEADSSLGPDSHHPIISLSGIPSAVIVWRILHPILASTLCAANLLAASRFGRRNEASHGAAP